MTQPEKDEFYGREDELLQLSHWQRQYFYNRRRDLPGLVTLVCGQHGVGKTELVRRFVQLNQRRFELVIWIPSAETDFSFLAYLFQLLTSQLKEIPLSLKAADSPRSFNQVLDIFFGWLQQQQRDWLLVVDDFELVPSSRFFTLLPSGSNLTGMVILIPPANRCPDYYVSTDPSTPETASESSTTPSPSTTMTIPSPVLPEHVLFLEGLSEKDGLRFLSHRAKRLEWMRDASIPREVRLKDRGYARQLVEDTNGSPEALVQASSYIRKTNSTFAQYYSLVFRTRNQMRSSQPRVAENTANAKLQKDPMVESMLVATILNLYHLSNISSITFNFLHLMSYLHPIMVPASLFIHANYNLTNITSPSSLSLPERQQLIDDVVFPLLVDYDVASFTVQGDETYIFFSRFLRLILREVYSDTYRSLWSDKIMNLLDGSFFSFNAVPTPSLKPQDFIYFLNLIRVLPDQDSTSLVLTTANFLRQLDFFDEAVSLYVRSIRSFEKAFGSKHLKVANLLNQISNLYQKESRYPEAIALQLKALDIFEELLGPVTHVANIYSSLSWLYFLHGDLSHAIVRQEKAVSILSSIASTSSQHLVDLKNAEYRLQFFLTEERRKSENI